MTYDEAKTTPLPERDEQVTGYADCRRCDGSGVLSRDWLGPLLCPECEARTQHAEAQERMALKGGKQLADDAWKTCPTCGRDRFRSCCCEDRQDRDDVEDTRADRDEDVQF